MAVTGAIIFLGPMLLGVSNTSEVRAQAAPDSLNDSSTLLARARDKIAGAARRLPKCTCLETIERTYYRAPVEKTSPSIMTEAPVSACAAREMSASWRYPLRGRCGMAAMILACQVDPETLYQTSEPDKPATFAQDIATLAGSSVASAISLV
jgi:hypothetical protein